MAKNPTLADVRARRVEIAKIIGPLKTEDDELGIAEKALMRLAGPEEAKQSEPEPEQEEEESLQDCVKRQMKGNETLEELIVLLFEQCIDDWWLATEVQDYLTRIKGREVPMSSVSPTLTKMKDAGTLVREGLKVALASRVPKQETVAQ